MCAHYTIIPIIREGLLLDDRLTVTARTRWQGKSVTVTGRLTPGFIVENERVIVRVTEVEPVPGGTDSASVWIPVQDITSATRIVLRSCLWEIPAGQERNFVLRKLSISIGESITAGGHCVQLAREMPGTTALTFIIHVPLQDATDYLWNFRNACRYCHPRSMPWRPPETLTAMALLNAGHGTTDAPAATQVAGANDGARANAAHYANQLPLWLTTRLFWSVFLWQDERLLHTIQFSLPDKLHRLLQRRFRLRRVADQRSDAALL